jgi:hypothetical protein
LVFIRIISGVVEALCVEREKERGREGDRERQRERKRNCGET